MGWTPWELSPLRDRSQMAPCWYESLREALCCCKISEEDPWETLVYKLDPSEFVSEDAVQRLISFLEGFTDE